MINLLAEYMRKKLDYLLFFKILPVFLIIISGSATAQNSFVKSFGGQGVERKCRMTACPDGGFLMASTTDSFGAGLLDLYLVKLNSDGQMQWSKTIGTPSDESYGSTSPWSIKPVSSGGYIIAGATDSFFPNVYLIRINEQGDTIWTKTYGHSNPSSGCHANAVASTSDGGFLIAGSFSGSSLGLIRTNSAGDTIWTRFFGPSESGSIQPIALIELSSGDFAIAGAGNLSQGNSTVDLMLMKISPTGQPVWGKFIGTSGTDMGFDVKQAEDGGIIVGGYHSFPLNSENFLVIKTNLNGIPEWQRSYGFPGKNRILSILPVENGILYSGITSPSPAGSPNPLLFRTDFSGNLVFSKKYNLKSTLAWGGNLLRNQNGSLFFCGSDKGISGNNENVFLAKTDSMGNSCNSSIITLTDSVLPISIQDITFVPRPNTLIKKNPLTSLATGGAETSLCNNTGISERNQPDFPTVVPNPCSNCHLETSEESFNWNCTDIFGRKVPVHFKKSETGFLLEFDKKDKPEILFLRHFSTGRVIRFIKE